VRADVLRSLHRSPEAAAGGDDLLHRVSAFMTPQLHCLFLHRVAHYLHVNGWRRAARALSRANLTLHKAWITP
jgi:serine acetyltransferase